MPVIKEIILDDIVEQGPTIQYFSWETLANTFKKVGVIEEYEMCTGFNIIETGIEICTKIGKQ